MPGHEGDPVSAVYEDMSKGAGQNVPGKSSAQGADLSAQQTQLDAAMSTTGAGLHPAPPASQPADPYQQALKDFSVIAKNAGYSPQEEAAALDKFLSTRGLSAPTTMTQASTVNDYPLPADPSLQNPLAVKACLESFGALRPDSINNAILIVHHNGKVLFGQRAEHIDQGGTWSVPSGKVEPDESPVEAAFREFREETGYQGQLKNIAYLRSSDEAGIRTHYVIAQSDVTFDVAARSGKNADHAWENTAWKWSEASDCPQPAHPKIFATQERYFDHLTPEQALPLDGKMVAFHGGGNWISRFMFDVESVNGRHYGNGVYLAIGESQARGYADGAERNQKQYGAGIGGSYLYKVQADIGTQKDALIVLSRPVTKNRLEKVCQVLESLDSPRAREVALEFRSALIKNDGPETKVLGSDLIGALERCETQAGPAEKVLSQAGFKGRWVPGFCYVAFNADDLQITDRQTIANPISPRAAFLLAESRMAKLYQVSSEYCIDLRRALSGISGDTSLLTRKELSSELEPQKAAAHGQILEDKVTERIRSAIYDRAGVDLQRAANCHYKALLALRESIGPEDVRTLICKDAPDSFAAKFMGWLDTNPEIQRDQAAFYKKGWEFLTAHFSREECAKTMDPAAASHGDAVSLPEERSYANMLGFVVEKLQLSAGENQGLWRQIALRALGEIENATALQNIAGQLSQEKPAACEHSAQKAYLIDQVRTTLKNFMGHGSEDQRAELPSNLSGTSLLELHHSSTLRMDTMQLGIIAHALKAAGGDPAKLQRFVESSEGLFERTLSHLPFTRGARASLKLSRLAREFDNLLGEKGALERILEDAQADGVKLAGFAVKAADRYLTAAGTRRSLALKAERLSESRQKGQCDTQIEAAAEAVHKAAFAVELARNTYLHSDKPQLYGVPLLSLAKIAEDLKNGASTARQMEASLADTWNYFGKEPVDRVWHYAEKHRAMSRTDPHSTWNEAAFESLKALPGGMALGRKNLKNSELAGKIAG